MKAVDLLKKDYRVEGNPDAGIAGVAYDSRQVHEGDLFIAVKGDKFNGHDFIERALNNGAGAVVYEERGKTINDLIAGHGDKAWINVDDSREAMAYMSELFYGKASEKLDVIGVTGTNGKTTTTYLIKAILESCGHGVGLIGTINYLIKDKSYDAPHTTPEACDFQRLLRDMAEHGCTHVVTEVSSHALMQKRVDYTKFKVALFTNLTRDHLDFHKTMEDYYKAKEKLFTDILSKDGTAVVNIDDERGRSLSSKLRKSGRSVLTYGLESGDADVRAGEIRSAFDGTVFTIAAERYGISETLSSPLVGITNVYNILSAVAAALALDIPIKNIKEGIGMASLIRGRFEKVDVGQEFLAVVDYAHTEDALERLLLTARQLLEAYHVAAKTERMLKVKRRDFSVPEQSAEHRKGKIIVVFGCGGNRDKGKRSKMGEIAAKLSDFVIVTSDNPRSEDPKRIIREIEKGIQGDNYIVIQDRNTAISMAVELASPGDIVLVAGKGHEEYQEINGIRHAFSDRVALESSIRRTISRPAFGGGINFRGAEAARC
ncbi:MAG: UDP-N-acetylmuramoyl-L-alanyl-D-glutamate--2,6-diaminopimelate ligase [Nitrospirae bacterium]|nr:MAG: UDP-N-acetylmuramoyl-L-alanyl-D-glutamate--2,6-diaminopimelate ligase [Nitrospirota bacterium]